MASGTTSASFYIAKALESIQDAPNVRYQLNPMGTTLESGSEDAIYESIKKMTRTVHSLGISRVGVIIKVDSRCDKDMSMEDKVKSVKRQMDS